MDERCQAGRAFVPEKPRRTRRKKQEGRRRRRRLLSGDFAGRLCAGNVSRCSLQPGQAKLIKAGSDIVFQLHYTANGKPGTDQSKVGLVFATEPPKERVFTLRRSQREIHNPAGRRRTIRWTPSSSWALR